MFENRKTSLVLCPPGAVRSFWFLSTGDIILKWLLGVKSR